MHNYNDLVSSTCYIFYRIKLINQLISNRKHLIKQAVIFITSANESE